MANDQTDKDAEASDDQAIDTFIGDRFSALVTANLREQELIPVLVGLRG